MKNDTMDLGKYIIKTIKSNGYDEHDVLMVGIYGNYADTLTDFLAMVEGKKVETYRPEFYIPDGFLIVMKNALLRFDGYIDDDGYDYKWEDIKIPELEHARSMKELKLF